MIWSQWRSQVMGQHQTARHCSYAATREARGLLVELGKDDLTDMKVLKKALSVRAGLTTDPLTSGKLLNERK